MNQATRGALQVLTFLASIFEIHSFKASRSRETEILGAYVSMTFCTVKMQDV